MSSQLRVLVVDDEIDAATSLTSWLQSLDCRTTCAFGAETGVRIAQLFLPDLVFLDLEMPGHGGCEVLAQIKSAYAPGNEPMFVCLTGTSSEEAEERCRRAGFHRFVRKPMPPSVLQDILASAKSRASREELAQPHMIAAHSAAHEASSRTSA